MTRTGLYIMLGLVLAIALGFAVVIGGAAPVPPVTVAP